MPRAEAPLIDTRTYSDLVADVEKRILTYTAGTVAPDAERLTGTILDQPVTDPVSGETFPAGTLVSRELAERLAAIEGLGLVKVKGWQPDPAQPVSRATLES